MDIIEIGVDDLPRYAAIAMRAEITSVLEPVPVGGGMGGITLKEVPLQTPYTKDYDKDGGGPQCWVRDFDVSNWAFFLALQDGVPVGGATVAWNTQGVNMLEGSRDMGVLWDLRVCARARRQGVGTALWDRAVAWLRQRQVTLLKVETQNVNVNACAFYRARGCELGAIHRFAYRNDPKVAHETMLLWYLPILPLDGPTD